MKFALGVLLLCLSTIIGYFLAGKYIDRKRFYNDFSDFNHFFKQEILFNKSTLIEILKDKINDGDFCFLLRERVLNKNLKIYLNYMNKDDKIFFDSYVKNLGISDIYTQVDFINKTNEVLSLKLNQTLEEEKRYKTLYIKMGFLIGLMLMIVVL